jgi:Regulator of G protein signaling domain
MLIETPEMEKAGSKRSSRILDHYPLDGEWPENCDKTGHDNVVSDYLRSQSGNAKGSKAGNNGPTNPSPHGSQGSRHSGVKPSPTERQPRASFMNSDEPRTDSNSPGHTVSRPDIRASAEKILYTFVLPGSEREIVLPEQILNSIIHAIEEAGRDDPEVFNDAKEYVFQAMERDAFPGFLQAKAFGNLVPLSVLIRLGLGLTCLMAGLWGGFYMILTDTSRLVRCWVSSMPLPTLGEGKNSAGKNVTDIFTQLILPFILGAYLLTTYQYKLDVVMAFLGFSEYTFMNWSRIREPYVRKLLVKRAVMALVVFLLVAAALSVLFILVPGTKF